MGRDAGIKLYGGNKRDRLIVSCDGLPFKLCYELIKETRICTACNKSFFGLKQFTSHCNTYHDSSLQQFVDEFDWVLMRPGGGHIEMNLIKSFFEYNWVPFMSRLTTLMGFHSELAQKYVKKCSDHHKSWRMLLIFYVGTSREMVHL